MYKNKPGFLSLTLHKNQLKMDQGLKSQTQNHKIIEDNIRKTFLDIDLCKECISKTPKANAIKTKKNSWDLIKRKGFCTLKGTDSKVNGQLTKWEKILTIYTYDTGLISRMYNELEQIIKKKTISSKSGLRT